MGLRRLIALVTHCIPVVSLQLSALLLLQSCKIDRTTTAPEEKPETTQGRAVFGSGVAKEPAKPRNRLPETTIDPDPNQGQNRARTAETVVPPAATPERDSPPSRVPDPGERRVAASRQRTAEPKPEADRFLHYQPPGSTVGDAGELKARTEIPATASTQSIPGIIRRWADTLLKGNLDSHMSLYAPALERFGSATNVGREAVRISKQRSMANLKNVRRFEIYDVRVRHSGNGSVTAEFRIESDAPGGVASYRLVLRQLRGEWKIYSEEKLQPVSRSRD